MRGRSRHEIEDAASFAIGGITSFAHLIAVVLVCAELTWLKVNVSVESQEIGILRPQLLLLFGEFLVVHQQVAQEIVHVHALRPALLMSTSIGLRRGCTTWSQGACLILFLSLR